MYLKRFEQAKDGKESNNEAKSQIPRYTEAYSVQTIMDIGHDCIEFQRGITSAVHISSNIIFHTLRHDCRLASSQNIRQCR
jgi:hypothetical protein